MPSPSPLHAPPVIKPPVMPRAIKITLDGDRRIQQIESDDFMIRLNGLPNQHYKDVLAPLGIELVFVGLNPAPPVNAAVAEKKEP